MVRPVVDLNLPQVQDEPVAAPVDTYVRPAQDTSAGSNLMDLAKSLAGFSQPLDDYVSAQEKQQAANDQTQAQADFVKNNQQGYTEAVAKGLIPASESPAYVNAYKHAQGDVAGQQMQLDALNAYQQSPAKNSLDPNAFHDFVTNYFQSRITSTDPEVLKGLMPRIQAAQSALFSQHLQDQDRVVRDGSTNMIGAQVNGNVDSAHSAGLGSPDGPNYDAAFAAADKTYSTFVGTGKDPATTQATVLGAITGQAISKQDPKILDFFDRTVPGQTYTWKSTPEGQKVYDAAVEKLDVLSRRDKVEQREAQVQADKVAKNQSEASALQIISQDPKAPLPDDLNASGQKYNGAWQAQVQTWRKQFSDASSASDPATLAQINRDIVDDPTNGTQHVIDGLKTGQISPSDFQTTYKFAQDVQGNLGAYSKVMGLTQVEQTQKQIQARLAPPNYDASLNPNVTSPDADRATSDYRLQVFQWVLQNPNDAKDPLKLSKALDTIAAGIYKNIQGTDDVGHTYVAPGGGQGNSFGTNAPPRPPAPAAAPVDNRNFFQRVLPEALGGQPAPAAPGAPQSGVQTPQAAPQAAPVAPAPTQPAAPASPSVSPAGQPEASPAQIDGWYKTMTSAQQQKVDAASAGDPAARADIIQRFMMKKYGGQPAPSGGTAPDGTPASKSSFNPGEATPEQPQGDVSAFSSDRSPGQLVDAALQDPHGALTAIQDAVDQHNLADHTSDDFEKALHAPATYQSATSSGYLKDNPKAASILDFVSGPESKGNYNAKFGDIHSSDDLSKYTLDEVMAQQQASTRGGSPSSAIGRYQFLRKTLRGLKAEMGLQGNEAFTPQLQDQLAMQLLKDRGFDDWQAGNITDQKFANNLAQEWASLPLIGGKRHGRSYYAGDGLNKALVSPAAVLRTLEG